MLLYTKVYGYICLQDFCYGDGSFCLGGCGLGMGAGHPPCKFISSMLEIHLHFMVKY